MILTRTPLRVSLFGGGTDHPEWFMENGGAVVGMAINQFVYVGVKKMPPGQEISPGIPLNYRVQYSKVDNCGAVDEIKHPAVRAALKYLNIDTPLEFHIFGDLPGRSGLGGSSAFSVGLLKALQALFALPNGDNLTLAREAMSLERYMIPETVGLQDQIFAAVGGVNYITFGQTSEVTPLNLTPEVEKELTDCLVLVYSGTMRDAHVIAAKQVENIPKNTELLQHLVEHAKIGRGVLYDSRHRDVACNIGWLLHESWCVKRELHPWITSGPITELYNRAQGLGAIGGKLLGAGGGGFFLFCVRQDEMDYFIKDIGAQCVRFNINHTGCTIIIGETP